MDDNINNYDEKEVSLPLSSWIALCENNIYMYAKQQMFQSGIPIDLYCTVMKCVLADMQRDCMNFLINKNAELLLNGKEVQQCGDSNR